MPLDLDLPYWIEDPDFDLDFHIRESAVPPPATREQVARTVARIVARPLDRARPLWELYVLHGLPHGRVGVLSKIHHAAVDGMSGAEILSVLLDVAPEGREVPPPARLRPTGRRRSSPCWRAASPGSRASRCAPSPGCPARSPACRRCRASAPCRARTGSAGWRAR